jgi:hypothetical protein
MRHEANACGEGKSCSHTQTHFFCLAGQNCGSYRHVFLKSINLSTCLGGAWGEKCIAPTHFLTSALDGGEWSASRPGRALTRGKDPDTCWIGDWVGPRAGLDVWLLASMVQVQYTSHKISHARQNLASGVNRECSAENINIMLIVLLLRRIG